MISGMYLKNLLHSAPVYDVQCEKDIYIKAISLDPEACAPDALYIHSSQYTNIDTNTAVSTALRGGATAVCLSLSDELDTADGNLIRTYNMRRFISAVACNFYGDPSGNIDVAGITGSHGKSTIGRLMCLVLDELGARSIFVRRKVVSGGKNRFFPLTLGELLRSAVDDGIRYGMMECSYTDIAEESLRHIEFDALIYTDLYTDRNNTGDFHYLETRKSLLSGLKYQDSPIIVNMDDLYANMLGGGKLIGYGLYYHDDVHAKDIVMRAGTSSFTLCTPAGDTAIELNMPGVHNIYNAMAVAAWACHKGIPLPLIKRGLEAYEAENWIEGNHTEGAVQLEVVDKSDRARMEEVYSDHSAPIVAVLCTKQRRDDDFDNALRLIEQNAYACVITSDYQSIHPESRRTRDVTLGNGVQVFLEPDHYKALRTACSVGYLGARVIINRP